MKQVTPSQFIDILQNKQKKVVTELGKSIAKCCATIQKEAMEEMRDTAIDTSKTYGKKGHHPSLPGNPPAVDTGTLRRSITYQVDENNLVGYVGSNLKNPPYGLYLEKAEYGTSRMKPRPWLKPATEKSMEKIKEIMAGAVKVGIYD
jgi:HK97 gp10 family phage protein